MLLRESYREGSKVGKRTLANLSSLSGAQIEAIRAALRGEALQPVAQCFEITASRSHGHAHAVALTMQRLGFASLVASKPSRERDLVLAMVAARIVAPSPKLATTRWWHTTTLAEDFGVADANEDDLYAAMDWLLRAAGHNSEKARRASLKRRRPGALRICRPATSRAPPVLWPSSATAATAGRACCRSTTACSPMHAAARWPSRCTMAMSPTARP